MSNSEQLALSPDYPVEPARIARAGVFSGERLKKSSPEKYAVVMQMLGQGATIREVANEVGVSVNTVLSIKVSEKDFIETNKKDLAARMLAAAAVGTDRLVENMDKLPLQSLPVAIGILVDKSATLSGDATVVIEHRDVRKVKAADLIASLPSAKTIDADVVDLNGFRGIEDAEQKESDHATVNASDDSGNGSVTMGDHATVADPEPGTDNKTEVNC